MNENELLYLASVVAQVVIAALGLGAVFYVLTAQRADQKADESRAELERHMSRKDAAIQHSLLLEGGLREFDRCIGRLAKEKNLEGDDLARLHFAGTTVFWSGRLKYLTQVPLRLAMVIGIPTVILALIVICTEDRLANRDSGTTVAIWLCMLTSLVLVFTARLIWAGSSGKPSVRLLPEESPPATAFFSQSRSLLVLHKRLFLQESSSWPYYRRQSVRRWRRKLFPVWRRLAPALERLLVSIDEMMQRPATKPKGRNRRFK